MSEPEIITETTEVRVSATPIAMSGIIVSMMMMAGASGVGFAYVPISLSRMGFEPWVAAAMTPALSFGGLVGCLVMGWLLRLSGHARIFMTVYALITLSFLVIMVTDNPVLWIGARMLYGFAINGAFIIAQSWLHDVATDDNRGRVITVFYVLYVVALGFGSFSIGLVDLDSHIPMAIAVALVTFAIIPVGLTRLRQPVPPEEVNVEIGKVWRISPVGLLGMLCVGGLTMTLQGFAPIYSGELGYAPADIGLLMLMLQMGVLVVQLPMGALSDRIDRRYVLFIVAAMSAMMALVMTVTGSNLSYLWLILVFAVWSGSVETIYSVSSAIANDRADPRHFVFLSSTQMIAWSAGAFIIPLMNTLLLQFLPVEMFITVILWISSMFAVFVLSRIFVRDSVSPQTADSFRYATAQVVNTTEYYNPEAQEQALEDAGVGVSEGLVK